MTRSTILHVLTVGSTGAWPAQAQQPRLASPEAALNTFIDAANRNDSVVISQAYALELTGQRFERSTAPIQSYRIVKKIIVDSVAASAWNAKGIVPRAMAGDVELQVDAVIAGKTFRISYNLRLFGERWRIYAHSAWGAP
jgi:hypothetical protein